MSACLLAMQSLAQTQQTFSLVTSQSELNTTDKYVIALQPVKVGKIQYGLYAMGEARAKGKGFDGIEVKSDLTELPETFTTTETLTTVTIEEGTGDFAGKYALKADNGYLSFAEKGQLSLVETSADNFADISFTDNNVVIKNGDLSLLATANNGTGGVKGSVIFNTYTTNQKPIALYVLKSGDTPINPEKVSAPLLSL